MRADQAVLVMSAVVGIAVILQSTEVLILRKYWSSGGPWQWTAKPSSGTKIADYLQADAVLAQLLLLQIAVATINVVAPNAVCFAFMFVVTLLVSCRFSGSINGAADSMTLYVLAGLFVATILPGFYWLETTGLCFVGFMSLWSYFRSGLEKAKNRSWWTGQALPSVLQANFARSEFSPMKDIKGLMKWLGIAIVIFELGAPIAILHQGVLYVFLALGLCFHLANALTLRLHRFFWIWAATFPAITFLAGRISIW